MKTKLFLLVICLAFTFSSQAQQLWTQLKDKLTWFWPDAAFLVDRVQDLAAQVSELAYQIWTSPETEDIARKVKNAAFNAADTVKSVSEKAKDVGRDALVLAGDKLADSAKRASEMGKQAADELSELSKEVANQIADTAKAAAYLTTEHLNQLSQDAGEKLAETAKRVQEAGELPAIAKDAIEKMETFADSLSSDLKNVAYNFGNCSSGKL